MQEYEVLKQKVDQMEQENENQKVAHDLMG